MVNACDDPHRTTVDTLIKLNFFILQLHSRPPGHKVLQCNTALAEVLIKLKYEHAHYSSTSNSFPIENIFPI